jgi:hypothetical protein
MKFNDRIVFFVFLALVVLVTWSYYGPFLHNYFTFDDFGLLELVETGPGAILLGYGNTLRFVSNAAWIPLYALSSFDPFIYNLFSMLFWLLNTLLLYLFLRRLLDNSISAALAGIIFTASAVGADAVLWRAANGTLFNVTFYLLTLYTYTVFRQTGNVSRWRWSVIFFSFAMFSKEEAASLPFIIILLEWLYFNGLSDIKGVARRILVYCAVIVFSVFLSYIVIHQILQASSELARVSKIRPFHSLFSGWTVFFLTPDGHLDMDDSRIYITAILIPLSFALVKDRRLLILGLGWIFFSFLPQSLSNISQFEPRVLCNSLSRHLYLPSIGAALVYTAVLTGVRERISRQAAVVTAVLFLSIYIPYNYSLLASRGDEWRDNGSKMESFLSNMKKTVPQMPPNTFYCMEAFPSGRAFVQQALRGIYNNKSITYIVDPANFHPKQNDNVIIINCMLDDENDVLVKVSKIH